MGGGPTWIKVGKCFFMQKNPLGTQIWHSNGGVQQRGKQDQPVVLTAPNEGAIELKFMAGADRRPPQWPNIDGKNELFESVPKGIRVDLRALTMEEEEETDE